MKTTSRIAAILLLTILTIGCGHNQVINVDGMPVSNHEYNLTNQETGIRIVFVLARYHREYEGKEYVVKPEYLDALQVNHINPEDTERFALHIKVINLKKQYYAFSWEFADKNGQNVKGLLYGGKLSRKDFYLNLPILVPGDCDYSFKLTNRAGDDIFSLPLMGYRVKGGVISKQAHTQ